MEEIRNNEKGVDMTVEYCTIAIIQIVNPFCMRPRDDRTLHTYDLENIDDKNESSIACDIHKVDNRNENGIKNDFLIAV